MRLSVVATDSDGWPDAHPRLLALEIDGNCAGQEGFTNRRSVKHCASIFRFGTMDFNRESRRFGVGGTWPIMLIGLAASVGGDGWQGFGAA